MKKNLGLVTLSTTILTSAIFPTFSNAEEVEQEQNTYTIEGTNVIDESNIYEQPINYTIPQTGRIHVTMVLLGGLIKKRSILITMMKRKFYQVVFLRYYLFGCLDPQLY